MTTAPWTTTARIAAPPRHPPRRRDRPRPPRRDPRKAEFEANKLRKRLRRQVGEAIGDYGLIEPRRPRDGLPVRRQGQLRPARHPADAQGPRAVPVRGHRREPRPEAAGLSRRRAAALPRVARRAVPHRRAGHLQRRQARHPRGRDDVLAVLAAAPRRALPRRRPRSAPPRSRSAIIATTSSRRSS